MSIVKFLPSDLIKNKQTDKSYYFKIYLLSEFNNNMSVH